MTIAKKVNDIFGQLSEESQVLVYKLAIFLTQEEGLGVSDKGTDENAAQK
ncbi:MAG: hypothetical protein FWD90_00640 [Defluviitaleaceae bacterium]|nr:hypothetical protein [Defluviitaleaceae bacterium]